MRLAVFAPALPSHVSAAAALAGALRRRGCEAIFLHREEAMSLVDASGPLRGESLGRPGGRIADHEACIGRLARPGGPLGVRRVVADMAAQSQWLIERGPDVVRGLGAQGVVADQMEIAGAVVARACGLPYVSVAAALPIERSDAAPPPMIGWGHDPSPGGVQRNRAGAAVADLLMRPLQRVAGLRLHEAVSPLASLWQLTPSLDFPRAPDPTQHYVGALRAAAHAPVEAPSRGRPRAYVSLGTLQGHRVGLLRRIARACRLAGFDALVTHCGRLTEAEAATIDATQVVADCDQIAEIARADVVVTHAGLNTVLDAAAAGKPTLALPIAFDQPGVAARLVHSGMGLRLDHRFARARTMADALTRLASEEAFARAAARIGAELRAQGGAERAADLCLRALGSAR